MRSSDVKTLNKMSFKNDACIITGAKLRKLLETAKLTGKISPIDQKKDSLSLSSYDVKGIGKVIEEESRDKRKEADSESEDEMRDLRLQAKRNDMWAADINIEALSKEAHNMLKNVIRKQENMRCWTEYSKIFADGKQSIDFVNRNVKELLKILKSDSK